MVTVNTGPKQHCSRRSAQVTQKRDVDTVTPEFALDLQNTSPGSLLLFHVGQTAKLPGAESQCAAPN